MPAVTSTSAGLEASRKVWTREETRLLVDLGFPHAEKLELIHGELIDQHMGKKHQHVFWATLVHEWLRSVFGWEHVRTESPVDVAPEDSLYNEPEPDLSVTRKSVREYDSIPSPGELLLVIEISDSSLRVDLQVKSGLYARAGILEYWVLDIPGKKLVVHRRPENGQYTSVIAYGADQEVSPLAAPQALFCLNRL